MLKYHLVTRKNPMNGDVKYYGQLATPEPLDIEAISKRIADTCTLTRHDIVACLSAFQEQMINSLLEGKSVHLGDLGTFRVTLNTKGADVAKDFTSAMIKRLHIRFYPASRLKRAVRIGAEGVKFSIVRDPADAEPSPSPQSPDNGF